MSVQVCIIKRTATHPFDQVLKSDNYSGRQLWSNWEISLKIKCFEWLLIHSVHYAPETFKNVKLRLVFVEIWWFYCHSDFAWNQILANSNSPKMSFLAILEVLNFYFSQFEQLSTTKFTQLQIFYYDIFGSFVFAKIWFYGKLEWQ